LLALPHIDELLNAVKIDFASSFGSILRRNQRITAADLAQFDYATQFADIQRAVEDVSAAHSRPGERKAPRRFEDTAKGQKSAVNKKSSAANTPVASPARAAQSPQADTDDTSAAQDDGLSDAERRAREVQRNIERMRAKRAAAASGKPKVAVASPTPVDTQKKARAWDGSTSAKEAAQLDVHGGASSAEAEEAKLAQLRAELGVGEQFDLEFEVESDEVATAAAEKASQSNAGGFWGYLRKLTVGAPLTAADLAPVVRGFRDHLVAKNVASEIADKLCTSVAATLEGKSLGSFASVSNAVRESMDEAMTRILTPKRNIDILRDVRAAKRERRPYSIVFVGVNGVGKCLARDTAVLMFDGSATLVQSIRVGDRVMGDDGSWRRVLNVVRGRQQMARVALRKNDSGDEESFVCNLSHVLSLRCAPTVCSVDATTARWHTVVRSSSDSATVSSIQSHTAVFSTASDAAAFLLEREADESDSFCRAGRVIDIGVNDFLALPKETRAHLLAFRSGELKFASRAVPIAADVFGRTLVTSSAVQASLPTLYKINDVATRRALLRGVLGASDVCGSVELYNDALARDIAWVARSLGLTAHRSGRVVSIDETPSCGEAFEVTLLDGEGEYFGFELNGNHRFVLASSLIVSHNSTSLAKVSSWLQQNKLSVMIAACDTFRSGAVEQLRVHSRCIGVELFERGYNKDAAAVAADAVAEAHAKGVDVVVIDTAGRMQDNEPLMRSLAKLVSRNQPDLILFVGEALVGNEAVDQVVKFNDALKVFSPTPAEARQIDGIVLTKFDTIDDKVGAAVSMAYTVGAPVVFVGTGQHYTDLKTLNVRAIVRALLK
jgi:signal recognition particle GTPase